MDISTKYDPSKIEDKWYKFWLDNNFFHSEPDHREAYTIVIPPPNVTGVLHMGHVLNNTIQDILVRRQRMKGKNTCWVPGTDHASIATEAKVVRYLKDKGINKWDLTRQEFLKHAWEWKERNGGIILEQLKKLGASCDWERTKFTMDDDLYESVIEVFIDLYNKGKIYRGLRMVNWDPEAKTAVSDEEVNYKEVNSKLYYVNYKIEGEDDHVTIATTRPETILGDTAVCVNPNDERFKHLKGKKVVIPLVNRVVPLIEDEYVDMEFGTGALKITPAHDENDYTIGQKHDLEIIDIFNEDGTLNEKAELFIGTDRFKARDLVTDKLKSEGYIHKVEDYVNKIGFSERTDAIIEPRLSQQWFVKMKELAKPAIESVLQDEIKFFPPKIKNIYKNWMENIRDWCISRQLWWGQRIPVYYDKDKDFVVARNIDDAINEFASKGKNYTKNDIKQDEDVVDTWFSSWLWPITVFNGIKAPDNPDYNYYYPTNDLVTAPEILFFWVARMIMAGYEYKGEKPFKNVYFTGIVRDSQRRKMSKSLGNSPNPLDLIKKYSADGIRFGILLCSPAGGDLLFDENLPQQGRNFCNKIWNAFRLVKNWKVDKNTKQTPSAQVAIKWFNERLKQVIERIEQDYSQYRLSEALMKIYRMFWDDLSGWYLELVKPGAGQALDEQTYNTTIDLFEKVLKIMHPFMPFITEELWHLIKNREKTDCIVNAPMPQVEPFDTTITEQFEYVKSIVSAIRNIRKENDISNKEPLSLFVKTSSSSYDESFNPVILKLGNLDDIQLTKEKIEGAVSFIVNAIEYYIPLGDKVNIEEERNKIKEELEYTRGFLKSVEKKLTNERFVQNAPEPVVAKERKKMEDAQTNIKALEERLNVLEKG
jgi:valyl-tRNA synthetase